VRIAVFNVKELSTAKLADVGADGAGRDPQALAAAAIVQRVRPDLLVVQEIDHDYAHAGAPLDRNPRRFVAAYLNRGAAPIDYPHVFTAPSNTGIPSGFDLDRDGAVSNPVAAGSPAYGNDCWGFGTYPGQYSMALLARHPIRATEARTFQRFLWRDLPGHHLPADFYGPAAAAALRLASKSHWDVPVEIGGRVLHLWISHPTPPGFDGDDDRNGRRNFDEIKFWVEYLADSDALVDDGGGRGGYRAGAPFVIAGDLNAAPGESASIYDGANAIGQLLGHTGVEDPGRWLASRGALAAKPDARPGPPDFPERATAVFSGGLRVDYLLPSRGVEVTGGGVFWPAADEDPEGHRLAEAASDHRLVWLDLRLP
jgi:endonuclease/exonuclease/phosphatase family metal-dependent hydrolase